MHTHAQIFSGYITFDTTQIMMGANGSKAPSSSESAQNSSAQLKQRASAAANFAFAPSRYPPPGNLSGNPNKYGLGAGSKSLEDRILFLEGLVQSMCSRSRNLNRMPPRPRPEEVVQQAQQQQRQQTQRQQTQRPQQQQTQRPQTQQWNSSSQAQQRQQTRQQTQQSQARQTQTQRRQQQTQALHEQWQQQQQGPLPNAQPIAQPIAQPTAQPAAQPYQDQYRKPEPEERKPWYGGKPAKKSKSSKRKSSKSLKHKSSKSSKP